jgi:hypothetical protein
MYNVHAPSSSLLLSCATGVIIDEEDARLSWRDRWCISRVTVFPILNNINDISNQIGFFFDAIGMNELIGGGIRWLVMA